MENDADISLRCLLIRAVLECDDIALLDLLYKLIISEEIEGRD